MHTSAAAGMRKMSSADATGDMRCGGGAEGGAPGGGGGGLAGGWPGEGGSSGGCCIACAGQKTP